MSSNKSMVSSSEELSRGGCYQAGDVEEDLQGNIENTDTYAKDNGELDNICENS